MYDVIVIGAGIAGASAAAELSQKVKVLLLEMEAQPGVHATGRSAALFSEMYGNAAIRALTRASRPRFFDPPADFCEVRLVKPRGVLFLANSEQASRLQDFAELPDVAPFTTVVGPDDALSRCSALRKGYVEKALFEPGAVDIEVDALHQAYLRELRRNGGDLLLSRRVSSLSEAGGSWVVRAGEEQFEAKIVVNAAGAWADEVAVLAGVPPIGLQPMRRTAILVDPPAGHHIENWPLVLDIDEQFYFKPDAGLLLLSPADETPVEPSDAQPEEWDVAVAVDRVSRAAEIPVRTIRHKWAGLRSFVGDRTPVVGFDDSAGGFFWLAGQGGYGVQTAPALGMLTASLALAGGVPEALSETGVDAADLSPARLGRQRRKKAEVAN